MKTLPHHEMTKLTGEIRSFQEIHALPGDWNPNALRGLLAELEIDTEGAAEADLLDLALMGLGDLEPHEASMAVLQAVLGGALSAGQRSNMAGDLQDDRPWEDTSDLSLQAGIFTTTVLLQQAFPKLFGKPDAARVEVVLKAPTPAQATVLCKAPPAMILRALAPGLGARSIVTRLYAEGVRGGDFPEAEHILWRCVRQVDPDNARQVVLDIHGARSFLDPLDDAAPWEASVQLEPGD